MGNLPTLEDDGLFTPAIGSWAERKYKLVQYYASLFATSMVDKWDSRVYIDLFAGPGRGRIKHTTRIIAASPLLAIDVPCRFDKYVFCEIDLVRIETLKARVYREFPSIDAEYIEGDSNANVDSIIAAIPKPSRHHTVLSFCFVDPFRLGNLRFATIEALSRMYVDFLVLIPAYMDAQRNLATYLDPANTRVEDFLGMPNWRDEWSGVQSERMRFGSFIVHQFGLQMKRLGYFYEGLHDTVLVTDPASNLALYRLVFFSRHPLGVKLSKQARKYTEQQLSLFELD